MECPKKRCKGRMEVYRTVAGKGFATQERVCIACGATKTYSITEYAENCDARTLAKRLREKQGE